MKYLRYLKVFFNLLTKTKKMTQNLTFFKTKQGRWYIDYPEYIYAGGTMADLEMVQGADDFLNYLSNGKDEVKLKVSLEENIGNTLTHTSNGIYTIDGVQMWLCPVTLFVFKTVKYPKQIYFQVIK